MIAAGIGLAGMAIGGVAAGGLTRELTDGKRVFKGALTSIVAVAVGGFLFGINAGDLIPGRGFQTSNFTLQTSQPAPFQTSNFTLQTSQPAPFQTSNFKLPTSKMEGSG